MALSVLLELVLQNLGLDLEVGQFFTQALRLYPELLPLLLADLDLLLHHDRPLDRRIVLRLEVFERGVSMACLSFEVIVRDFYIAQPVLQGPVRIPQRRDFFLQGVLGGVGLGLGFLVFPLRRAQQSATKPPMRESWGEDAYLPLVYLVVEGVGLLAELILPLLCGLQVLLQLLFEFLTRDPELGQLGL